MNPEQYMRILTDACNATVTSRLRLATNIPVCDGDGYVRAIRRDSSVGDSPCPPSPPRRGAASAASRPAASRPAAAPANADSDVDEEDDANEEDDNDCDVETSGMCDAGHVISDDEIVVGALVAVPFLFR